ncbi:MAG TPA: UbiD family decarboxylase, partial [Pseudonocardiaceae bacterium]
MKRLADLRAFLAELAAMDDLVTIESEVDWNLELGAVIRRSYDLRAPAPLFTNITGIEAGYRALGAPGGLRADPATRYARIAVALGLPPTAGGRDIIDALDAAMGRPGMPPRIVNRADAPCREVVLVGDAVDLMRFPSPLIHQGDGGRYLQTYGLNMVRTPDGSWTNASVNRMML